MKKADINKPAATMYPNSRRAIADYPHKVLKPVNNKKLGKNGATVQKGQFKNYSIFTLTLEERATCPRSCFHWDDCFGNNMMFAHRLEHGRDLEIRIRQEISELCATRRGVLVRLHVLGDFYSAEYVRLWNELMTEHANLAVWGYTHRDPSDDIGREITRNRGAFGARWSIRWSDIPQIVFSANSESLDKRQKGHAFVCPEQEGKTKSCATCALCWEQPKQRVVFLTH